MPVGSTICAACPVNVHANICSEWYAPLETRRLGQGIDDVSQLSFSHRTESREYPMVASCMSVSRSPITETGKVHAAFCQAAQGPV